MKKSHSPIYLLLACLILTGLLGTITFLSLTYQATAATPAAGDGSNDNAYAGPGGRGGRPTMVPTAQLRFAGSDAAISPGILSPGQPMTYTFTLLNDGGTMIANNATLEIPWNGNQTFIDFSSNNPDWKVKSVDSKELFIDLGNVAIGETGKIIIHATFATNYLKTIYKQTVYLNWNDEHAARHAGTNLFAQVNLLTTPGTSPAPGTGSDENPTPTPGPNTSDVIPTSGAFAPVVSQANTDSVWYFPATQHTLSNGFLQYWKDHGSVTNLGYPISQEFQENGRTVQYFERVVMEYWPENPDPYKVLLRSIGVDINGVDPGVAPDSPTASDGSVYYPETGHWLDGRFVDTWKNMGGLAQFGFPITEPVIEGNTLIQWTERARFELDLSRPNQLVTLGLVGEEDATNKGY